MDSEACKVSKDLSIQIAIIIDLHYFADGKLTPSQYTQNQDGAEIPETIRQSQRAVPIARALNNLCSVSHVNIIFNLLSRVVCDSTCV